MPDASAAEEYTVEALLDYKVEDGVELVLVKWKGYDKEEDNTWEELTNLGDGFEDELKALKQPPPVKRGRGRPPTKFNKPPNKLVRQKVSPQQEDSGDSPLLEPANNPTKMLLPNWKKPVFSAAATTDKPLPEPEAQADASSDETTPKVVQTTPPEAPSSSPPAETSKPTDSKPTKAKRAAAKTKETGTTSRRKRALKVYEVESSSHSEDSEDGTTASPASAGKLSSSKTTAVFASPALQPTVPAVEPTLAEPNAPAVEPVAPRQGAPVKRARRAALAKPEAEPVGPLTAPVTLLSPDYVRTVIREELERHRVLALQSVPVKVKHLGGPPPGLPSASHEEKWGLVEDLITGKHLYIPMDDIRKRHSQALVDYLLATETLKQ